MASKMTSNTLPTSSEISSQVGGNPAKLIKHRFSDETIADLLEIQLWNWPMSRWKAERATFDLPADDFVRIHRPEASISGWWLLRLSSR